MAHFGTQWHTENGKDIELLLSFAIVYRESLSRSIV